MARGGWGQKKRANNFLVHEMPLGHDAIDDDDAVIKFKLDFGTLVHMVHSLLALLVSLAPYPKPCTLVHMVSTLNLHLSVPALTRLNPKPQTPNPKP